MFSAVMEKAPSTLFWSDKSLEGLVLIKKPSVSETLQGLCCFQGLSMDMTVKGLVSWSSLSQLHLHNSDNLRREKEMRSLTHQSLHAHSGQHTCKTNVILQKYHATQAEGFCPPMGCFNALSATTNFQ